MLFLAGKNFPHSSQPIMILAFQGTPPIVPGGYHVEPDRFTDVLDKNYGSKLALSQHKLTGKIPNSSY